MLDVKNIRLSQDELARCIEFSQRSAPNQQAIEFGQRSTKARSTREIARDNLIGKIAEVAFSKMMKENYGIDVPLDFNYYPRGQWDNQDAVINGWRIDVKGTRKGGPTTYHIFMRCFPWIGTEPQIAPRGASAMRELYR